MSKRFTVIMTVMVAGMFLLGTLPAYAIPGIRAARAALTARKAKQKLAENEDPRKEDENAQAKGAESAENAFQPADEQPPQQRRRRILPIGGE